MITKTRHFLGTTEKKSQGTFGERELGGKKESTWGFFFVLCRHPQRFGFHSFIHVIIKYINNWFFFCFLIGRYPGHDGGYVSDPYGATTPGGGHPAYGEHSPFQTVPNLGGGGGPNDPWVPPGDLGGHHNGMQAQVYTSSSSTFATFNESSNYCV
jgi:hypothetical protein